jgi:hypothetical protein
VYRFISGECELVDESDYGFGLREQVSGIPGAKVERNAHGQYLVRGRLFDPTSKPKTFNQVGLTKIYFQVGFSCINENSYRKKTAKCL